MEKELTPKQVMTETADHILKILRQETLNPSDLTELARMRNNLILMVDSIVVDEPQCSTPANQPVEEPKVRTYRDILNTIEDVEIREKALANCEKDGTLERECYTYDPYESIVSAFIWDDTPEGGKYWYKVAR